MSLLLDGLISAQRYYLELRAKKAALEEEVADVNQRLADLQANLAEQMAAIGQTHTTVDGQRLTVAVTPRVSIAEGVTGDDLCEILKGGEFDFLVKPRIHSLSLQSAMREYIEQEGGLPPDVAPLLKVWNQVSVKVQRA